MKPKNNKNRQMEEEDEEMQRVDAKESWRGRWTEGEGGRRNTLSDTATGRRGRISPPTPHPHPLHPSSSSVSKKL